MNTFKVKDLITYLQTLDDELPIHTYDGGGNFHPLNEDVLPDAIQIKSLMKAKLMKDYYGLGTDTVWKDCKERFEEPFDAVVLW